MNKEQKAYTVIDKETSKIEFLLINDWLITPIFTRRKDAVAFMKEKFDDSNLKVIKCKVREIKNYGNLMKIKK